VLTAEGILRDKVLNSRRGREPEGVDALVIVSSHEELSTLCGHRVHELQVHRVEVLEFVDHEVLQIQEGNSIECTSHHVRNALPHNLAGEDA
jgi:hypothetical protein